MPVRTYVCAWACVRAYAVHKHIVNILSHRMTYIFTQPFFAKAHDTQLHSDRKNTFCRYPPLCFCYIYIYPCIVFIDALTIIHYVQMSHIIAQHIYYTSELCSFVLSTCPAIEHLGHPPPPTPTPHWQRPTSIDTSDQLGRRPNALQATAVA